jgi:hypothetical protein
LILLGFRFEFRGLEKRVAGILATTVFLVSGSGCSLSMFSGGDGFDRGIQEQVGYRKPNIKCVGLDLSSSTIDTPTFRRLTDCFNSQGALDPIARLVSSLSDEELAPVVDLLNESLLNNSVRLYDLESSFNRLATLGILDDTLERFGRLLENTAFVEAGVRLLDQAYLSKKDTLFVDVLARISARFDAAFVGETLDFGITLSRTGAFQELLKRTQGDSPGARKLRRDILEPLILLLREQAGSEGKRISKTVLKRIFDSLQDGSLYRALDARLGGDSDDIRTRVPPHAAAIGLLGKRGTRGDGKVAEAAILDDLSSLFHATMGEIRCFKGAQRVERANLFIIQELIRRHESDEGSAADFLRRTIPLTLTAIGPFCDYPTELGRYYPSLSRLAETDAIDPVTGLLVELDRAGLSRAIIDVLGATGSGELDNRTGIKRLLPVLAEISDRRAWDDLIYFFTSLSVERRARLAEVISFLLEPLDLSRPEGPSILDGMIELGARVRPEDLEAVLQASRIWLDSEEPILDPIFSKLREAFHINDVHPVVDLIHSGLEASARVPRLCETLLGIAKRPEFEESVRLVARMSKDGSLRELASSLLTLFHKFADKSEHPIQLSNAPALREDRRHNWSTRTVSMMEFDFPESATTGSIFLTKKEDPCLQLGFSTSIDQITQASRREFELFALCIGSSGDHQVTADILTWMRDVKLNGSDRSLFALQVELLSNFGKQLTLEELQTLTNAFIVAVDDRRMHRLLHALPHFTLTRLSGGRDDDRPATLSESAVNLIREVVLKAQNGLRIALNIGAEVLRDSSFPQAADLLVGAWRAAGNCDSGKDVGDRDCSLEPEEDSFRHRRALSPAEELNLATWIHNWECTADESRIAARLRGVKKEYHHSMNSWELVDGVNSRGQKVRMPRMEWTRSEFDEVIDPLVKRYQDLNASTPERSAIKATANVIRYFNVGGPKNENVENKEDDEIKPSRIHHFHRDGLFKWLSDRADDHQPIAYIYPGENRPRVRLVSTIERFELLLWNANVQFLLPQNLGFQFLQMIGEAWGDEASTLWPEDILKKYPEHGECDRALGSGNETLRRKLVKKGHCPMTLQDVWERDELFPALAMTKSMKTTMKTFEFAVGLPQLAECPQVPSPTDPGAVVTDDWRARSSGLGLIPDEMRVRIFNIKQLLSVVPENLPGAPAAVHGPKLEDGLKVLRNLFFELLYSSPEECRNPKALECNNLKLVPMVVQNGMLRKVVQKLREFPAYTEADQSIPHERQSDYRKLKQFFRGMGEFTNQTGSGELLQSVVGRDPGKEALVFKVVVDRLFDMAEAADPSFGLRGDRKLSVGRVYELSGLDSRGVERIREEWKLEERRMRKMALDFVALAHRMGVIDDLVPVLETFLRDHADTLADQKRLLLKALRSKQLAHFLAALDGPDTAKLRILGQLMGKAFDLKRHPDLDLGMNDLLRAIAGPSAVGSASRPGEGVPGPAELLVTRASALSEIPSFQVLELDELIEEFVDTFLQISDGNDSTEWKSLSIKLRLFLADRLGGAGGAGAIDPSDIQYLMSLVADEPARFQELMETLGRASTPGGALEDFMELARRSLKLQSNAY